MVLKIAWYIYIFVFQKTSIHLICVFMFVCMPRRACVCTRDRKQMHIISAHEFLIISHGDHFCSTEKNHFYFFSSLANFYWLLLFIPEPHVNRKNSFFACTNYAMLSGSWTSDFQILFLSSEYVRVDETNNASKHTRVSVCMRCCCWVCFFASEEENKKKKSKMKQKKEREIESLYTLYLYWFFVIIISKMVRSCHGIHDWRY